MTKAPERIWAWPNTSDGRGWYAAECSNEPSMAFADVEYIRADLVDPAAIREAALREAAEMVFGELWVTPWELQRLILDLIDKKEF